MLGDLISTHSAADGSFQLSGLPTAPGLLRVDAAGLARLYLPLQPPPETLAVDLGDVLLETGASLRVLAGGEAPEDAVAKVDLRGQWLEPDMVSAAIHGGEAEIDHLPPNSTVTLTVMHGRTQLCERAITLPASGEETEVECSTDPLELAGNVLLGELPAGSGTLVWSAPGPQVPGIIVHRFSASGSRQSSVAGGSRSQVQVPVEDDGSFYTREVTAGTWKVSFFPASGHPLAPREVVLPETDAYQLELRFPSLSLRGRVVNDQGEAVPGARVRETYTGTTTFADLDGSFQLPGLEPGLRQLQARLDEETSEPVEIQLEADREPDPVRLVLTDTADRKVLVHVFDDNDQPIPGAFVFLQEDQRPPRILTADLQGMAQATLHPPYPQRVRAAAVAAGQWTFGPWIDRSPTTADLTLQVPPSGSAVVLSDEAAGNPQIVSPGGWDLTWLLLRLGTRPQLTPGQPLRLQGLPAGRYALAVGNRVREFDVRSGRESQVELQ